MKAGRTCLSDICGLPRARVHAMGGCSAPAIAPMQPPTPILKDIVLVGAGHAHVSVLRMFGMDPLPGVRLTLITRQAHTPYSGMLPGVIAGVYTADEAHIDTGPLSVFAGARLYCDEAIGLDLAGQRVLCRGRPPVPYDLLSIDIGSTPGHGGAAGVGEHAIPVKPIDGFLARFEAARARVLERRGRAAIAVVGAGAGGVELTLALETRLRAEISRAGFEPGGLALRLVDSGRDILAAFPKKMRARMSGVLRARGVEVLLGRKVVAAHAGGLTLDGGVEIAADEIFWTTQAAPAPWLADTGLGLDGRGFIRVGATLQSVTHPDVFAAGDIASMDGAPRPKSGVFAVRVGPPLAQNLRRAAQGRPLAPHRPQREAMYLLSTADGRALGARNGFAFEGAWVWRWKDRIDRRFMAMFNALPEMRAPDAAAPAESVMRCGGCGAKVGASVLSRVLGGIEPARRDEVIAGLASPDDAAIIDAGGPELSVRTVDYFRAVIDDPYVFGKIAANHALGDIFAMGGTPRTALAIATVPFAPEAKIEADLSMMMTGANEILRDAGCALVGGHTSEGAELSLGFSIDGGVARDKVLRKSGLVAGDALILTKAIGTGALMAAHMRGKAKARHVLAALALMTQSSRVAADILSAQAARAATDVTGFGLVGHLLEMLRASGADARVDLPAIALLDGVKDALAAGTTSSMQPQNLRQGSSIRNYGEASAHPLFAALFDPQTAGGLLAGVPRARASACVDALRAAGYVDAAVVGEVLARSQDAAALTIAVR